MKEFANTVLKECSSTNDLARELALDGYPEGSFISAEKQTHGRGRQEREWVSDSGNLYLSILCTPPQDKTTWVPLLAGMSVLSTIRECLGKQTQIKLKWPNDLMVEGAKLGGILCEAFSRAGETVVIVGIGMNVEHSPKNVGVPTTFLMELDPEWKTSLSQFRIQLIKRLKTSFFLLKSQTTDELRSLYERDSLFKPGEQVTWRSTQGNSETGKVLGLAEDGSLEVEVNSIFRRLYSEEVTALSKESDGSLRG